MMETAQHRKRRKCTISHEDICGGSYTQVEYNLHPIEQHPILFAGLYPPASATKNNPYNNRTCYEIQKYIQTPFDFIDVYPYSPKRNIKSFKLYKLSQMLNQDSTYRTTWSRKIIQRLKQLCGIRVVYICGQICQSEWKKCAIQETRIELDIYKGIVDGITFYILYGVHPSAHLEARGNPLAVSKFDMYMKLLHLLSKGCITNFHSILSDQDKIRIQIRDQICKTLCSGSLEWTKEFIHMEKIPFHSNQVYMRLQFLFEKNLHSLCKYPHIMKLINNGDFWIIMTNHIFPTYNTETMHILCHMIAFHIILQNQQFSEICPLFELLYNQTLSLVNQHCIIGIWNKEISSISLINLLSCRAFCIRIFNHNERTRQIWKQKYDNLQTVYHLSKEEQEALCATNTFVSNYDQNSELTISQFEMVRKQFSRENAISLFSCSAFCSRVGIPEFWNSLCKLTHDKVSFFTLELFVLKSFYITRKQCTKNTFLSLENNMEIAHTLIHHLHHLQLEKEAFILYSKASKTKLAEYKFPSHVDVLEQVHDLHSLKRLFEEVYILPI